jgi:4-amino-4-deoxy-L-arabinose transferase-like glycosyltransferase
LILGSTESLQTPLTIDAPRAVDRILPWLDRHRWWFFVGIAILYVAGFNGQWRMEPDGALYLSIARNIAEGKGYTYHGRPHHLAYPGLPYLLAGIFRVFGDASLLVPHAVMVASAGIVLVLTYHLIRAEAGRPTAVMVTILLACTFQFYAYAYQLRNDMPFVVGVMMFLLGFERLRKERAIGSWALMVIGLFIAVVMRPAVWALLPAVIGAIAWGAMRGRRAPGRWSLRCCSSSRSWRSGCWIRAARQVGGDFRETTRSRRFSR